MRLGREGSQQAATWAENSGSLCGAQARFIHPRGEDGILAHQLLSSVLKEAGCWLDIHTPTAGYPVGTGNQRKPLGQRLQVPVRRSAVGFPKCQNCTPYWFLSPQYLANEWPQHLAHGLAYSVCSVYIGKTHIAMHICIQACMRTYVNVKCQEARSGTLKSCAPISHK